MKKKVKKMAIGGMGAPAPTPAKPAVIPAPKVPTPVLKPNTAFQPAPAKPAPAPTPAKPAVIPAPKVPTPVLKPKTAFQPAPAKPAVIPAPKVPTPVLKPNTAFQPAPAKPMPTPAAGRLAPMKKGGAVKKMASGGKVFSASKRADGIAQRGKTRGKYI